VDLSAETMRGRSVRAVCIGALALLFVFALSACDANGDGEATSNKTPEELNFSAASAADAGVYGLAEEDDGDEATPESQGEDEYPSFGRIQDSTGAISMEVPTEWSEVVGDASAQSPFQAAMAASPDLEGYEKSWDFPGVFLGVSKTLGAQVAAAEAPEVALSSVFSALSPREALKEACDPTVTPFPIRAGEANVFASELSDLVEFGQADFYTNCGGNGAAFVDLAGLSKDRSSVVYMQVGLVRQADIGATRRMVETLQLDFTRVPAPGGEQEDPELVVP